MASLDSEEINLLKRVFVDYDDDMSTVSGSHNSYESIMEFKRYRIDDTAKAAVVTEPSDDPVFEQRIKHLMKFPQRQQQVLNSGNSDEELEALFTDCCTENVVLEPPSSKFPRIVGRANAVKFVAGFYRSMPDLLIICEACKRYKRVITSKTFADGTFIGGLENNPFKTDKRDPLISDEAYAKYNQLEAEGKPMLMRSKNYMYMVLNKEMTHIEKIITVNIGREVYELGEEYSGSGTAFPSMT